MHQNPYELLLSLKQTDSVENYREQFELYAGPLRGVKPEYLKDIFLNGLKDAVKAELKLHPVTSLLEMMDFAQRIDEKNALLTKGGIGSVKNHSHQRHFPTNRTVTYEPNNKSTPIKTAATNSTGDTITTCSTGTFRGRTFKHLTDAEMQEKLSKGLCFLCDEKFGPGHVYVNNQSNVPLMDEGMEEEEPEQQPDQSLGNLMLPFTTSFPHLTLRTR